MAAYLLVSTRVLKNEGWERYQSRVGDVFAQFGGKYVVRREAPQVLEGTSHHDRVTLFEFPSMEAIDAMWESPEYREVRPLRDGLGLLDVLALNGV